LLRNGKGKVTFELDMVLLCREMKWDYFTYVKQPAWFLDLIKTIIGMDAEYQNALNKKKNGR